MTDIGDISGMGAAALRELAAPLKRFRSPGHALLWFETQREARDAHGVNLSGAGGPRSQESIDTANRTFGVLADCRGATDKHDDPEDPPIYNPVSAFSKLTDWCRPKGFKGMAITYAAEREGMGTDAYNRWMTGLRNRWRKRLEARDLLIKEELCACGCGVIQQEEL